MWSVVYTLAIGIIVLIIHVEMSSRRSVKQVWVGP